MAFHATTGHDTGIDAPATLPRSQPPNAQEVWITLSQSGTGCQSCGASITMDITRQLPICAPQTITWDANQGVSGPHVLASQASGFASLALAGNLDFTAFDPTTRAAGSYSFEFGGGQTLAGTFDAIACPLAAPPPCP